MTNKAQDTAAKRNDLPVIAPLKVGDDWLCCYDCPQATDKSYSHCLCEIDGEYRRRANDGIGDHAVHLCPHHYRRTAARLEAAKAQLAVWESQDAHEGMDCYLTTKRLEVVEAWVAMLWEMRQNGEDMPVSAAFQCHAGDDVRKLMAATYPRKDGK